MDSAAQRLQHALSKVDRHAFIVAAKAAGMDPLVVGRAFGGKTVPALTYMRLCSLSAIDAVTGQPVDSAPFPQRIAWPGFASALKTWAKHSGLNMTDAARISKVARSTVGDASRGYPVSTESFLALCAMVSRHPDIFLSFAPDVSRDVSRETLRRNCGEALQPEAQP